MTRQVIVPPRWSSTLPVSAAVAVGQLLFVSGQTARDGKGVEEQTRMALEKLGIVLQAGGSDYTAVVRCGVYLRDPNDFDAMNRVYGSFFASSPPARSTIICALAVPDILVEIDCVAEILRPAESFLSL